MRIHVDPDPGENMNANPCGSGSPALILPFPLSNLVFVTENLHLIITKFRSGFELRQKVGSRPDSTSFGSATMQSTISVQNKNKTINCGLEDVLIKSNIKNIKRFIQCCGSGRIRIKSWIRPNPNQFPYLE